jgi:hypothetical protein
MHEWSTADKWRPFCSERCKLIDLGAWIQEQHAIPGEPAMDLPPDNDVDGVERRH